MISRSIGCGQLLSFGNKAAEQQSCVVLSTPSRLCAVQVRFFCNAMPWVDCTALRYHCTKLPDIDLCPEAFADGRFPPGCTARDFIRLTGARAPQVIKPSCFAHAACMWTLVSDGWW